MKIENFNYLLEIVRYGSISEASEKLHLTRQALSSIVQGLEKELGVLLFHRTNTGVVLTEAGKEVCTTAKKILGDLKLVKKQLAEDQETEIQGTLVIYTDKLTQVKVLPQILLDFLVIYPKVQFTTEVVSDENYFKNRYPGNNEIYLFSFYHNPVEKMVSLPIAIKHNIFQRNEILIGKHSGHIIDSKEKVSLSHLKGQNIVINAEEFDENNWLGELLDKCGFDQVRFLPNAFIVESLMKEYDLFTIKLNSKIPLFETKDIIFLPFETPLIVDSYYFASESTNIIVESFIKKLLKSYESE